MKTVQLEEFANSINPLMSCVPQQAMHSIWRSGSLCFNLNRTVLSCCPINAYDKSIFLIEVLKVCKLFANKCVSRTDTNPPFAFNIAFSRAQVLRGFYRGYRDS